MFYVLTNAFLHILSFFFPPQLDNGENKCALSCVDVRNFLMIFYRSSHLIVDVSLEITNLSVKYSRETDFGEDVTR